MKLFQRTIYIVYIYCLDYPSLNFGVNYWYQRLITMINILNNFVKIKINELYSFSNIDNSWRKNPFIVQSGSTSVKNNHNLATLRSKTISFRFFF